MVDQSVTRPTAPLIAKLDDHYVLKTEDSTDDGDTDNVQRSAVDRIEEELLKLRHVVEELRIEIIEPASPVEPAASPVDPLKKIDDARLYLSTVEGEEDLIVLNGNSPRLANDIRYGALYGLSLPDAQRLDENEGLLRAELRGLDTPGQGGYAAIGRIPKRPFERLGNFAATIKQHPSHDRWVGQGNTASGPIYPRAEVSANGERVRRQTDHPPPR